MLINPQILITIMGNKNTLITFITGNAHKFNEVRNIFETKKVNYQLKQLDLNPIEIQAENIKEVAKYKLNSIRNQVNGSCFIEDAGFFVDSPLHGFPGVYSSYVFKTIGNEGILKLVDDVENPTAHFSAIIALYFEPLDKTFLFEGDVVGKVSRQIRGSEGFGFDPIFIPNEIPEKTFGELPTKQKNEISHRGKALEKLIKFLEENSKLS